MTLHSIKGSKTIELTEALVPPPISNKKVSIDPLEETTSLTEKHNGALNNLKIQIIIAQKKKKNP